LEKLRVRTPGAYSKINNYYRLKKWANYQKT
jgi:hypothetical protein